jgi:hypothetical protein
MAEIDLLAHETAEEIDPDAEPRMANPHQGEGTLEEQARAYLDANCAHCHRPGGWVDPNLSLDLRYEVPLEDSALCDLMTFPPDLAGIPRIDPGNPQGSGILKRFLREDEQRMPSVGTSIVDPFGTELLRNWIAGLRTCP